MIRLQSKTVNQLFKETVNLEFDYFLSLLGDMSIADFGERVSMEDASNNGIAFYFDDRCIFTVTPPDPEESVYPIPAVERFYLNPAVSSTVQ